MRTAAVQLDAVMGDVAANLGRRGAVPTFMWHYRREHGKRWYARHTRGLPPVDVPRAVLERRVEL